jgi:hypothetical protein
MVPLICFNTYCGGDLLLERPLVLPLLLEDLLPDEVLSPILILGGRDKGIPSKQVSGFKRCLYYCLALCVISYEEALIIS